jgi:pimeloyl-ACP methyl ester carboxylesterase
MRHLQIALTVLLAPLGTIPGQASTTLPTPGGPFAVGRRTLYLVDSTRREIATPEQDDRRRLTVHIWYPAQRGAGSADAPYMPDAHKYRGVVPDRTVAMWDEHRSPVIVDGPAATGSFPVLLFSHGWNGRAASHSIWLSEVASHGFVVVGVDHPYMGMVATELASATAANDSHFPSPRYADLFYAEDLRFVRDRLQQVNSSDPVLRGAVRLDAVIAAGHSSGHAAASAFAALYPGVRALISFDAGVSLHARERGLSMPLLLIRADRDSFTGVLVNRSPTGRGTTYDSSFVRGLSAPFLDLRVAFTDHNAISDNLSAQRGPDSVSVRRAHRIISRYTVEFLRSVVQGGNPVVAIHPADEGVVTFQRVTVP